MKQVALTAGAALFVALMVPAQAQALGTVKGTCLGHAHPYGPYGASTSSYAQTYAYPDQACPPYTVRAKYGAGGGGPTYWTSWKVGGSSALSVQINQSSTLNGAHGGYGDTQFDIVYS
jgi:hypothetical protein